MSALDGFYPVTIRESRYGGNYEGGAWWLTGGVSNPTGVLDIAGGDNDCMAFWATVHDMHPRDHAWGIDTPAGRIIEHPAPTEYSNDHLIVVTGDSPQSCLDYATELLDTNAGFTRASRNGGGGDD